MNVNFQLLNEIEGRVVTRATAHNFFVPRVHSQGTNTFFYSSIKSWNDLPNELKCIEHEKEFKEKLKQNLVANARKLENDPFLYY